MYQPKHSHPSFQRLSESQEQESGLFRLTVTSPGPNTRLTQKIPNAYLLPKQTILPVIHVL